jgi:hypothetical protein
MTACGGGSSPPRATTTSATVPHYATVVLAKHSYETTMRRLGARLGRAVDSLFPLVEAKPGTAVGNATIAKLQRTRAVVLDVAAHVAAITPPSPVRMPHRRLLVGLTRFGSELDELIRVLQTGSTRPFGYYTRFSGLHAIAVAHDEIVKDGFAIG